MVEAMTRPDDLKRFYDLLGEIAHRQGGPRRLADCSGRLDWPERGVYFFFEPGENRTGSGGGQRVVRVGTHALKLGSKTRLWGRLSQHRGTNSGKGNHRGSIFRLLIGEALMRRDGLACESWGRGATLSQAAEMLGRPAHGVTTAEESIEKATSGHLGQMSCVCLDIPDDPGPFSLRGEVERKAIALLSNLGKEPVDPPSPGGSVVAVGGST